MTHTKHIIITCCHNNMFHILRQYLRVSIDGTECSPTVTLQRSKVQIWTDICEPIDYISIDMTHVIYIYLYIKKPIFSTSHSDRSFGPVRHSPAASSTNSFACLRVGSERHGSSNCITTGVSFDPFAAPSPVASTNHNERSQKRSILPQLSSVRCCVVQSQTNKHTCLHKHM